jgi:S-layer family protein
MNIGQLIRYRATLLVAAVITIALASGQIKAESGTCGGAIVNVPFTDVSASNIFFCSIASAYFSGLTSGTSATTFNPNDPVSRGQMAAFITRTQDSALRRGSRRAALDQWAAGPFSADAMTTVDIAPISVKSDGADLWVANYGGNSVSRVRASDGRLLETWTGAISARCVLVARGRIFVTGFGNSTGQLYSIDPTLPAGAVSAVAALPTGAEGITTDGPFIWTANRSGSVSKVNPETGQVTTFTTGFQTPWGILYDGANIWVTDFFANTLLKLNLDGSIAQTVAVGMAPRSPVFDGTNIWVPNSGSHSVTVVRASTGAVLATLIGDSMGDYWAAAFDGQRVLVTDYFGDSVSLWKAADLTPLGTFSTGTGSQATGACSDGVNFWVTLGFTSKLARF